MIKFIKKSNTWALGIIGVFFTVVLETTFGKCKLLLMLPMK